MFPRTLVEHVENADRRNYRVSFERIRHQIEFDASCDLGYGIGELNRAFEDKEIVPKYNPSSRLLQRALAEQSL